MLVILFVVQVARVLLDLVHAQTLWVDLLGAEVERLEVAVELTLLLTVLVGDPDVLGRLTRSDEVPLGLAWSIASGNMSATSSHVWRASSVRCLSSCWRFFSGLVHADAFSPADLRTLLTASGACNGCCCCGTAAVAAPMSNADAATFMVAGGANQTPSW
ncbi:hypothetical protein KC328_g3 [Hortaea werneckii]|nr:hypothetical protein KC328_g3 [Hortaea werneckii]